jgi:hypothetical protein
MWDAREGSGPTPQPDASDPLPRLPEPLRTRTTTPPRYTTTEGVSELEDHEEQQESGGCGRMRPRKRRARDLQGEGHVVG